MPQPSWSNSTKPKSPGDDGQQLVLVKDAQRYAFRYEKGEESQVLASLIEMAKDPGSDFNWFDAAVLCHQLGRGMSGRLQQLLKPSS